MQAIVRVIYSTIVYDNWLSIKHFSYYYLIETKPKNEKPKQVPNKENTVLNILSFYLK